MRPEGSLGDSRFVPCALAVRQKEAIACQLLVAMPSAAISQTGHLVTVRSFPRPVIALDAISKTRLSCSHQNSFKN